MLKGTWLGMIPHYEFIMPTVSTVMSGRAPCQLLHATVTARQWAAGSWGHSLNQPHRHDAKNWSGLDC